MKYLRQHCAWNFFREELLEINDHLKWMLTSRLQWKHKLRNYLVFRRYFIAIHAYFIRNSGEIPFLCVHFCCHSNNITFVNKKMLKTSALAWMARLLRHNFYIEIPPLKSILWSIYETFFTNLFCRHYFNCIDFVQSWFKHILLEQKLCCIRFDCTALWKPNKKPEKKQNEKIKLTVDICAIDIKLAPILRLVHLCILVCYLSEKKYNKNQDS